MSQAKTELLSIMEKRKELETNNKVSIINVLSCVHVPTGVSVSVSVYAHKHVHMYMAFLCMFVLCYIHVCDIKLLLDKVTVMLLVI